MQVALRLFAALSLILTAAIFGFFYAWICSTMWGLDAADPRVAIAAMQAMNASVRNAVFAPAFFGTPVALLITAMLALAAGRRSSATAFAVAALVYFSGALLLTANINVPMNEALGAIAVPQDIEQAREIWTAYSQPWQFWNVTRTIVSAVALLLCGTGIWLLGRSDGNPGSSANAMR